MDKIDIEILRTLQTNGRITNSDLAKKVGLSAPSVLERVRKLEEANIITGYEAKINREKVGRGTTCFVAISLSLHQEDAIEEFQSFINQIPEVLECHHVTGEEDFLLRVAVKDMKHYEDVLLNHLVKIPGTSKIKTMVVLSSLKASEQIEIDVDSVDLESIGKTRARNSSRR